MRSNQKNKPTRRKPDRPNEHGKYSTVPDYSVPWTVIVYPLVIVALFFGIPAAMAWTHLHGWW